MVVEWLAVDGLSRKFKLDWVGLAFGDVHTS
jgi:hypothetical protein